MNRRRLFGSLAGAALTLVAWQAFGVTELLPRLLVALVGFGVGHGVVRLAAGKKDDGQSATASTPRTTPRRSEALGTAAFVIVFVLAILAVVATYFTMRGNVDVDGTAPGGKRRATEGFLPRRAFHKVDLCRASASSSPA